MKIVYVSNYVNHHTKDLCWELYRILDGKFTFIETKTHEENGASFKMGYAYYMADGNKEELPWVFSGWQKPDQAKQIILDADAVITANCSDDWVMHRLKRNKLTFRAHERWYRRELPWYKIPRAIVGGWLHHGRFPGLYLLSASAYTASDAARIGCFRQKAYRWGYFPRFRVYTHQQIKDAKENDVPVILWAGRFVDWKRADDALLACKVMQKAGFRFQLRIAGSGPEEKSLHSLAMDMGDSVQFLGVLSPEQLRDEMEKSNIFLFTSDFQEGWGVVLNEAMNSGCAVVASHAAGAAPYLIQDGKNGLIYQCGNIDALAQRIRGLLDSPSRRLELGLQAYETILTQWSPKQAAVRFVDLCAGLMNSNLTPESHGPCSVAPIIKNAWYPCKNEED